jgi:hypothetical protein
MLTVVSTNHQDIERNARASLIAFILRARRIEKHSLASDRAALELLARMPFKIQVTPSTGTATWIQEFPPEEQVESAAARVWPLILNDDPTHYGKALTALGYLLHTSGAPEPVMKDLRGLKAGWTSIQPKGRKVRGYYIQVSKADSGEFEQLTDNVLGFAWIYGDVVHADAERLAETRTFGVRERFRAAVPLVAHIMVLTIGTLNFIRLLHQHGVVSGLDGPRHRGRCDRDDVPGGRTSLPRRTRRPQAPHLRRPSLPQRAEPTQAQSRVTPSAGVPARSATMHMDDKSDCRPGFSGGFRGAVQNFIYKHRSPDQISAGQGFFSVGTAGFEPTTPCYRK